MPETQIQDADIRRELTEESRRLAHASRRLRERAARPDPYPLAAPTRAKSLEQERRRQLLRAAELLHEAAALIESALKQKPRP